MEWRPIETAPKDGTEILFCRKPPYGATGNIIIGFWNTSKHGPGWMQTPDYGVILENIWTHWMPLPPPPERE